MKTAFTIEFRGKVREQTYTDGTLASRRIQVPKLERRHVADMGSARSSRKYGGFANSDLFPSMLNRAAESIGCRRIGEALYVDLLGPTPAGITVDESGFLALVRIDVPEPD